MQLEAALRFTQLLIAVAVALSSFELWFLSANVEFVSIFDGKIMRSKELNVLGIARHLPDWLFADIRFRRLALSRLLLGISLFVTAHWVASIVCALIMMADWLLQSRFGFGGEGSDQMTSVVLAGLIVANLTTRPAMIYLGLGFIAIQGALSYLVSGIAKAVSAVWRKGGACFGVMNTRSYGNRRIARYLLAHPQIERFVCNLTIGFEVLFGIAMLQNSKNVLLGFLAVGAVFHLTVAVVMGLNGFFWSFVATYPAMVTIFEKIHRC